MNIMFACLNCLGKYPVARQWLNMFLSDVIMLCGRFLSSSAVIPVGPGAFCFLCAMVLVISCVVNGGKSCDSCEGSDSGSGVVSVFPR